jgi:hypothetical protein
MIGIINPCFSQDSLANKGLISDAENYRNTISSKHKNPFTKISKEQFNQKIDSLISIVPYINKDKFTFELFKINSLIEDEHTILFPDYQMELPFKFELFDEGLTIIASDSLNQKYLLYRVLSINNNTWSKIDSLYKSIIKRDNQSYFKFFETFYFNNSELLKGLGIIGETSAIPFQLLSPSGDTINTTINSNYKSKNKSWIYAQQFKNLLAYSENSNYWFKYDEKNKTLYFNYQHCNEDEKESFKTFNKRLFQIIEDVRPAKIILDLRFNGGGNSGVLKPFIESIKKSELNTNERFFVIIGRKVMSSSLMNAIELKNTTNATFVGEQTGGNINHFGELKSFELLNSKIRATYSTKYWENWKNHSGAFKPDIETSNTFSDFLNSYDKAIEIIFQK